MKKIFQSICYTCIAAVLFTATGCKKDFDNPNAATSAQVFSSAKGLMGTAIGIQRTFSLNVVPGTIDANGLVTNETILLNPGNTSEFQLTTGGTAVDGTNALLGNIWISANKCIYDANNVIAAAQLLGDKGYASGLIGYCSIIKALSIGSLAQYWEKVPDTVGTTATIFIDRIAGYNKAIAIINTALTTIATTPISTGFNSDLPAGIDIVNTLNALKARYSLFAGNYATALASATAVSLTAKSTFNFEATNPNPVFFAATSTNNLYQPIDSTFGLPVGLRPALTDQRVSFYTTINATINPRFRLNGFWIANTTAIPVYLPDEMKLIRAECLLRQATPDVANAKLLVDAVLMQAPSADPVGVGANIAAGYTGTVDAPSLLNEVYRNRCIELYLSGLKLEDMRRFARPTSERKRNFFPYPFRERDSNSNTPADPSF
ncbi:MAG: RagB/SusD family nutrient uptake outer membrane protein [Flavobacterium sp.]|nr:RagB/SusD family nutrient uptake outer membrane protein [Flavobacterium sp.]